MTRRAALVTDAYWRKTVAVVRSLGAAGCPTDAADSRFLAPASLSRHCRRRLRCPDADASPAAFGAWLATAVARGDYALVLPGEQATCEAVSRVRSSLPPSVWAAVPPEAELRLASDKLTALARATAAGIPVPETAACSADTTLPAAGEWIVKPRRGGGSYGVRRFNGGEPSFNALARSLEARFGSLLVQAFVPGERNGYGVSLAYGPDGACRAGFVHRKLREFPASGGVSTCAESVHRPDLIALARRFVEGGGQATPIPWEGVINFEFKVDETTGRPFLIEVNPRLWGALPLAIRAEVDFPKLLWRLSLGEIPKSAFSYRPGVRLRWLVYGDIAHAIDRLRSGRLAWEVLADGAAGDFLWDPSDPLPFWGSLAAWALAPFTTRGRPLLRR